MRRLEHQIAFVTGAASGIGRSIAELFAEHGARVVIADVAEVKGRTLAADLQAKNFDAFFIPTDVTRADKVKDAIRETVERFGGLHILVNNAAVWEGDTTITDVSEDVWQAIIDGTLKSVYLCTKHAIPEIIRSGGGSIVNVSSINAVYGVGLSAYTAAKGGVVALTKLVAAEYGQKNIRANVILPGTIGTESALAVWRTRPEAFEAIQQAYAVGRIGNPLDVAYCALYLASSEAAFVTGATFVVDGGLTAGKKLGF